MKYENVLSLRSTMYMNMCMYCVCYYISTVYIRKKKCLSTGLDVKLPSEDSCSNSDGATHKTVQGSFFSQWAAVDTQTHNLSKCWDGVTARAQPQMGNLYQAPEDSENIPKEGTGGMSELEARGQCYELLFSWHDVGIVLMGSQLRVPTQALHKIKPVCVCMTVHVCVMCMYVYA